MKHLLDEMTKDFREIMENQQDPEYQEKKRIQQLRKQRQNNELLIF